MEAEIQWHIDAGRYDPATQEAVIIMGWGPRPRPDPKTYRKGWTSELPAARKHSEAEVIIAEVNELPKYATGSTLNPSGGPIPEPKPEPRRRIKYPDMGII